MRIAKAPAAILLFGFALAAIPLAAQTSQNDSASSTPTQLDVSATQRWTDTKLDMRSGEKLQIAATGSANYAAGKSFSADGLARGWK
ncbi:MAG: hypothetical protein WBF30_04780, partial [Candidatus Acidiferrales bacterium]